MKFPGVGQSLLVFVPFLVGVPLKTTSAQQELPGTSFILGGITNVASTATNFRRCISYIDGWETKGLSDVVQRQKELLHRVSSTATDYVASAVEMPRSLLMNATKMTTNYIDSAASIGLDFKLRRILEKFRSRMRQGFPEFGVPTLEPLELRELYLRTRHREIGNVTLYLDEVMIDRLSSFNIDRARLSLIGPTVTVNVSMPLVLANGYYNISGILGDLFKLHGSGMFDARASDFRVYFKTVLGYSRGMYMKSFDLDFSMESVNLKLENFMGGDEMGTVMTEVFQELIPQAVEIIKPEILPPIQDFIASRVNETINHLTMRDVLSFLLGEGDLRSFPLPLL